MTDEQPSEEGRKRYPPDGYWVGDEPCTCTPECPFDCKGAADFDGACSCYACSSAYCDAMEQFE